MMKPLFLCLVLISAVLVLSNVEANAQTQKFISYEVLNPCNRPGGPHPGCPGAPLKLGVKAPPVRIDSQAKYGALSRGDGAIYLRFPHKGYREKIWDHAAGAIVVTEAGGVVTNAGRNPLDFSKGRYLDLDTGIIVTNPKLMPMLLKAVRESLDEKASSL
ncbi:hypothetical protein RHGRI_038881 [Rhododendron griersonianum]|uniref:Uncharacterized protein n=1 Tax=Rhododendron griersonianum TaxID=479676 RepID=A0AAV6HLI0_9ERIC|nr:hypothetical protein RHGRI_038881 [Rhododendron griersonianum]